MNVLLSKNDGIQLLYIFTDINDRMSLENNLDELYRWSKSWKLNFNSLKCTVISFPRKSYSYKVCDLGATIDGFLTHNAYIKNVINTIK